MFCYEIITSSGQLESCVLCWTTVLAPALQLGVKTIETVRELLDEIVRGLADLIVPLLDCVFTAKLDSWTQ